jgi:hypothetical protein
MSDPTTPVDEQPPAPPADESADTIDATSSVGAEAASADTAGADAEAASGADPSAPAREISLPPDTPIVAEAESGESGEADGEDAEPAASADGGEDGAGDGEPEQEIDAIVCIPGIGIAPGTALVDVAERMATALDNCAGEARSGAGKAIFTVATRDAKTRNGAKLTSAAILRHETPDAKGREVLHLYEFDYRPKLSNGLEKRPPAVQAAAMAWTLLFSVPSVVVALARFRKRRSKGWGQKLHVVYGVGMVMAIVLYVVLLGASAVAAGRELARTGPPAADSAGVVSQAVAAASETAAERAEDARERSGMGRVRAAVDRGVERASDWFLWLTGAVIIIPLAGTFVRFNMRDVLESAAPPLSSATGYLVAGQRRAEIIGDLAQVLNHLDENGKPGKPYRKVHLAGYSFGSVIALDALFQPDTAVNARLRGVSTVITIGCPHDFIRTYWPRYFADRHGAAEGKRPRWINVYAPVDVLGSNFIDEPTAKERAEYRRASAAERMAIRRKWDEKYARGVDLIDGPRVRPAFDDNLPFGTGQGDGVSLREWVAFIGFRVHGMYWSRESARAINCFEPVMTKLYETDAALKILA